MKARFLAASGLVLLAGLNHAGIFAVIFFAGNNLGAAIRQTRAILPHYFIAFIIVIVDSTIITSGYLKQQ